MFNYKRLYLEKSFYRIGNMWYDIFSGLLWLQ
jgi:hypothetical protein